MGDGDRVRWKGGMKGGFSTALDFIMEVTYNKTKFIEDKREKRIESARGNDQKNCGCFDPHPF